jgi:DNA-binding MarR family transcriptional regulator
MMPKADSDRGGDLGAARRPQSVARHELDQFYSALSALAREYQFRDREAEAYGGLSVTECYVLEVLAEGEMMSVSAVAHELRLDKSTASRAISGLEEAGLVRRLDDPQEHRAWRVILTTKGHAAVARASGRVKEQVRPVLSRLSLRARRELIVVLRDVARLTRERMRGSSGMGTAKGLRRTRA